MATAAVKKELSKKEIVWVHYVIPDGHDFYITSLPDRLSYTLYQKNNEGYHLLAKSKTPGKLNEIIEKKKEPVKKTRKKKSV